MGSEMCIRDRYKTEQISNAIMSMLYAGVMLSYLYSVREGNNGAYTVWLIFLCSWGSDTCAYLAGVAFGKHKMAPVLSPKKSVEGAVGGVVGAAALGDIGKHFPDTDPKYKGISSVKLLIHVAELLKEHGYEIGNIDATIIAQKPKMAPHIPQMRANMAKAMGINESQLNIKATTEEKLGFTGREEGIASQAICLLNERKES